MPCLLPINALPRLLTPLGLSIYGLYLSHHTATTLQPVKTTTPASYQRQQMAHITHVATTLAFILSLLLSLTLLTITNPSNPLTNTTPISLPVPLSNIMFLAGSLIFATHYYLVTFWLPSPESSTTASTTTTTTTDKPNSNPNPSPNPNIEPDHSITTALQNADFLASLLYLLSANWIWGATVCYFEQSNGMQPRVAHITWIVQELLMWRFGWFGGKGQIRRGEKGGRGSGWIGRVG